MDMLVYAYLKRSMYEYSYVAYTVPHVNIEKE